MIIFPVAVAVNVDGLSSRSCSRSGSIHICIEMKAES